MLEKLIELLAPDECVVCGTEGACICEKCSLQCLVLKKPSCIFCNRLSDTGKTCPNCYKRHQVSGASVALRYEDTVKGLVVQMKYNNKRSIARYFAGKLADVSQIKNPVVCFVPSDGRTRRKRGYDQAEILARSYAKRHELTLQPLLVRSRHSSQVGKSRLGRFESVKGNFVVMSDISNKSIVLIDDVITTGATVSECAKMLKKAGAKSVWVVAIAKG